MTETTKRLITQATSQINTISETINTLAVEMKSLAQSLPEYPIVMEFRGVGDILGPQLIAARSVFPALPLSSPGMSGRFRHQAFLWRGKASSGARPSQV
jgi:hypothetical protein